MQLLEWTKGRRWMLIGLVASSLAIAACGEPDENTNNGDGQDAGTNNVADAGDTGIDDDTGISNDTGNEDTTNDTTNDTGNEDTGNAGPCGEDEYVQGNACVACPTDQVNEAGDDPTGADTACDIPLEVPNPSFEVVVGQDPDKWTVRNGEGSADVASVFNDAWPDGNRALVFNVVLNPGAPFDRSRIIIWSDELSESAVNDMTYTVCAFAGLADNSATGGMLTMRLRTSVEAIQDKQIQASALSTDFQEVCMDVDYQFGDGVPLRVEFIAETRIEGEEVTTIAVDSVTLKRTPIL